MKLHSIYTLKCYIFQPVNAFELWRFRLLAVWSFASLILPVLHVSTDDLQEIGIELYKAVDIIFIEREARQPVQTEIVLVNKQIG